MHLEDEEIQRVLHGESEAPHRSAWLEHIGQCSFCRQRVEQAGRDETEIFGLLGRLDHPVPDVRIERLMRATRASRSGSWRRKAAVIALVLGGAGAAYAAPGSPLPGLIRALVARLAGPPTRPAARSADEPSTPAPSGIAVRPGDRFTIAFTSDQPSGAATVRLTDGPDIEIRAMNGTAAFLTDLDRLTVSNQRSASDYQIEVPRSARRVEILVEGRRVFLKQGSRIVSETSVSDDGGYHLLLHPRGP